MRNIFKLMLGLLLFNTVFTLYAPIFNTGTGTEGISADNTQASQYNLADMNIGTFLNMIFLNANALAVTGIVSGIALTAAIISKNYVYLGVGIFIGIITSMYTTFSGIISQLGTEATGGNIYVVGIITIIGIAIGVLAMFNIVDMFAPAPT